MRKDTTRLPRESLMKSTEEITWLKEIIINGLEKFKDKAEKFRQEFDELSKGKDLTQTWREFCSYIFNDKESGIKRYFKGWQREYKVIMLAESLLNNEIKDEYIWKCIQAMMGHGSESQLGNRAWIVDWWLGLQRSDLEGYEEDYYERPFIEASKVVLEILKSQPALNGEAQ